MLLGAFLILAWIGLSQLSGALTRKYIVAFNPEAKNYSAARISEEFKTLAGRNIIPTWVSLITLLGYGCLIGGLVALVKSFF